MLLAASSPRCLFLSSLGAIYCAAFLSCWLQYPGILGSDGLLPASSFWLRVRQGGRGGGSTWERFCSYPSLLWLVEDEGLVDVVLPRARSRQPASIVATWITVARSTGPIMAPPRARGSP